MEFVILKYRNQDSAKINMAHKFRTTAWTITVMNIKISKFSSCSVTELLCLQVFGVHMLSTISIVHKNVVASSQRKSHARL